MRVIFLFILLVPSIAFAEKCQEATVLMNEAIKAGDQQEETEVKLRKVIALCPTMAEGYYHLGLILAVHNKVEQAIENFKRALNVRKEIPFLLALAKAQVVSGSLADAAESYRAVLKEDARDVSAMIGLAVIAQKERRFSEGEDLLRQALQINPNDATIYYNLGIVLESQGMIKEAAVSYSAATRKRTNFYEALLRLGIVSMMINDNREAEDVLRQAAVLNSRDITVWLALSKLYESQGNIQAAKEELAKARQITPDNVLVLLNSGILEVRSGELDKGIELLKQALNKNAQEAAVASALGWAYVQKKDYALAEQYLRMAIKIDDRDALAHNNLGVVLEELGKKSEARAQYLRAKELGPGVNVISKNLELSNE